MPSWVRPVHVRPFGRLLCTYTVNELGDSIGAVALALLVFDRSGIVATATFFVVAKFLPALLSPLVVPALDHRPLRAVLPTLYVLEAIVFSALALIADHGLVLGAVLALGLIDGSIALVGRSLTRAAVAHVLQPEGLLQEGNGLMNVGFAVASVGGAALGGVLITTTGLPAALFVDAASFALIAILMAATPDLPSAEHEQESWLSRLRAGLRFVREPGPVRRLLGGQAFALVCFTLIVPIEVVYARQTLGTSSAGFGALLAAWGAGIVVGSLIFLRLKGGSPFALIVLSTAAVGIAYLGMAATTSLVVACALSVLGGAGNGVQWIAVVTALQQATPPALQARVTGFLESLGAATPGVGYVIGGALAALVSPRAAYAVAGAGVLALVAVALVWRPALTSPGEEAA